MTDISAIGPLIASVEFGALTYATLAGPTQLGVVLDAGVPLTENDVDLTLGLFEALLGGLIGTRANVQTLAASVYAITGRSIGIPISRKDFQKVASELRYIPDAEYRSSVNNIISNDQIERLRAPEEYKAVIRRVQQNPVPFLWRIQQSLFDDLNEGRYSAKIADRFAFVEPDSRRVPFYYREEGMSLLRGGFEAFHFGFKDTDDGDHNAARYWFQSAADLFLKGAVAFERAKSPLNVTFAHDCASRAGIYASNVQPSSKEKLDRRLSEKGQMVADMELVDLCHRASRLDEEALDQFIQLLSDILERERKEIVVAMITGRGKIYQQIIDLLGGKSDAIEKKLGLIAVQLLEYATQNRMKIGV
ncbi:MAG: hypothetical protein Q7T03_04065 [Deltaproteobacteria bacterium]|nr:hypothetical protein [Deltaproteobacteria bacterium]